MAQRRKPAAAPRRNIQIAIYAPPPLYNMVVREAEKRRRKLGPTCEEILWEYFNKGAENVRNASSPSPTI
jgi:hypothetical protein